jgi:hypothetical protein
MSLTIENLSDFYNEYLLKSEPNTKPYNGNKNITCTQKDNNYEIIETIVRPLNDKPNDEDDKQIITNLTLTKFETSIHNLSNKIKTKLIMGEYEALDGELKSICEAFHSTALSLLKKDEYILYSMNTDFLIIFNNKGELSRIEGFKNKDGCKEIDDLTIKIFEKFVSYHNIFLELNKENLKNKIYIYKLTSPYITGKEQIYKGMQTEHTHMDQCNIGESNYEDDRYCELSSIIYTHINNENKIIRNKHYYASASFFYAPEVGLPINGETENDKLQGKNSNIHKFQKEYNRFFLSAPMTSSGWAIWKNRPKRYFKNEKGNRFNKKEKEGYNIKPIVLGSTIYYKFFSEKNDEYVMHASPFKSIEEDGSEICNWAPTADCDAKIKRGNMTIRRSNYNFFRVIKDMFYENDSLRKVIATGTIKGLKSATSLQIEPLLENLSYLLRVSENYNIDYKNIVLFIYNKFVNDIIITFKDEKLIGVDKFECEDGLKMLDNYCLSIKNCIEKFDLFKTTFPEYETNLYDESKDKYYDPYKNKYLKYKSKYLQLKKLYNL